MIAAFNIKEMHEADGQAVLAVYQEGMDTGHAIFHEVASAWSNFDRGPLVAPRLVAVAPDGKAVLGWAAGAPI